MDHAGVSRTTVVVIFVLAMAGAPVMAQDEGNMNQDEISDMIDDLGGPQATSPTTTASVPPPTSTHDDFSSRATEHDAENDEEGAVDREMSDSGEHERVSDRWHDSVPDVAAPATPIPSGDKYNSRYDRPAAKKKKLNKKKKIVAKKISKGKKVGKKKSGKVRRVAGRNGKKHYRIK